MLNISKQLYDLQTGLKADFEAFKADFKHEMKEEIVMLKQEIGQQIAATKSLVQVQSEKLEEAQTRIAGLETWSAVANNAIKHLLKEQRKMIDKTNDQESRGRRNNLRIYGVPEGEEKTSTVAFVEGLLRSEKLISEDCIPQIQRAHRSLGQKPGTDAPPRSIIVNFLEFRIKESILRNAWSKKIFIRDKLITFDHDYTSAVVQQRRAYKQVKSALKAKGIRFQSPYTNLRIHWETGTQMYRNPEEAIQAMRQRGIEVEEQRERGGWDQEAILNQLEDASPWQLVPRRSDNTNRDTVQRTRVRLQEFQRNPN